MSKNELDTSKELLHRVASDDHDAFRQLFDRYADRLHAAVYHYTKSRFVGEELTQEVFIRLWRHRRQLGEVQDPAAYLYRMVFNQLNTYLKRAANEKNLLERARSWMGTNQDATRQQVEANELTRIITAAVERLPPRKKIIYRLSKEQGFNNQQIAEQLGLSPSTVKNHLVGAMKLLRAYLKDNALGLTVLIVETLRP